MSKRMILWSIYILVPIFIHMSIYEDRGQSAVFSQSYCHLYQAVSVKIVGNSDRYQWVLLPSEGCKLLGYDKFTLTQSLEQIVNDLKTMRSCLDGKLRMGLLYHKLVIYSLWIGLLLSLPITLYSSWPLLLTSIAILLSSLLAAIPPPSSLSLGFFLMLSYCLLDRYIHYKHHE